MSKVQGKRAPQLALPRLGACPNCEEGQGKEHPALGWNDRYRSSRMKPQDRAEPSLTDKQVSVIDELKVFDSLIQFNVHGKEQSTFFSETVAVKGNN
jgi:hypothetical protein